MPNTDPPGPTGPNQGGKVARNFLILSVGEVVARLLMFGAFIYLARVLGAASYGVVAFAVGATLYLVKFADFSIESLGSRQVARDPDNLRDFAASVMSMRLVVTLLVMLAGGGVCALLLPEPERGVMVLFMLTLLPVAASTQWVHMGMQNGAPVGVAQVLNALFFVAFIGTYVHGPDDLRNVPLAQFAADAIRATLLYLLLLRIGRGFGLRWRPSLAMPVFRQAAPLVGYSLLALFLYNADLIFLRAMRDGQTVGYYAAAYMPVSFLGNIAFTYATSLIPALAREEAGGASERALYHNSTVYIYAGVLPITVGGAMVAGDIIELGFGAEYAPAAPVLAVLFLSLPGAALRNPPYAALLARGRLSPLLRTSVLAVITNGVLNLLLIGPYGMLGAACATISSEVLAASVSLRDASSIGLPFPSLRRLLAPSLSCAAMASALFAFGDLALPLRISLGGLVYAAGMLATGAVGMQAGRPIIKL